MWLLINMVGGSYPSICRTVLYSAQHGPLHRHLHTQGKPVYVNACIVFHIMPLFIFVQYCYVVCTTMQAHPVYVQAHIFSYVCMHMSCAGHAVFRKPHISRGDRVWVLIVTSKHQSWGSCTSPPDFQVYGMVMIVVVMSFFFPFFWYFYLVLDWVFWYFPELFLPSG